MNERIRELYYQAFTMGTSGFSNGELDVEKFAQLIVAECISVMKSTVEVSVEDHNRIIVNDLKHSFYWNRDNEETEYELLNAIEVVLQYYMKPSEYSEWFQTRGRE